LEKVLALRANRRSFDCASRDETARGSAQDDNFYILRSLKFGLYVDTPLKPGTEKTAGRAEGFQVIGTASEVAGVDLGGAQVFKAAEGG
jgi:hypothetical protein